jgi:hypothetical protein
MAFGADSARSAGRAYGLKGLDGAGLAAPARETHEKQLTAAPNSPSHPARLLRVGEGAGGPNGIGTEFDALQRMRVV